MRRPGISVKLSAIHPRFDPGKEERLARELAPRLLDLATPRAVGGLTLTVDAEEQDRLDLTLGLFAAALPRPGARWLGGPRPGGAGLRQAGDPHAALVEAVVATREASASRSVSSRAPTGTARSNGRRSAASPTIRSSRASCIRMFPISPACASCSRTGMRSFRSSPPTTRIPLPSAHVAAAMPTFEFQRLHGMGEAVYEA